MYNFKRIPSYFLGRLHISLGKISIRLFSYFDVFYKLERFHPLCENEMFFAIDSLCLEKFCWRLENLWASGNIFEQTMDP